jgi:MFS family permease
MRLLQEYRWRLVLVGALISALVGGSLFYGLGAFFGPIQSEFNWSYSLVSGAFSVQYVMMGLAALVFGWFFDRIHPAWLAVIGVTVTAGSLAALSLVSSPLELYLVFAAMGIGGAAATFLLFNSLVALWFRKSLGLALAVVQTGYAIGSLSATGFVALANAVGWRLAAVLVGATIATVGLPACPAIRLPASGGKVGERRAANSDPRLALLPSTVVAVLRSPAFWVILVVIAVSSAITQAVYAHQIRAMVTFGLPTAAAGLAAGLAGIVGLAGRYGFGLASERFSSRNLFAVALVLQGVGTVALSRVDSKFSIAWFVVLFGIGQSAIFLLSPVLQRDFFGTSDFGTIQGLILGPSMILSAVGPLAVGVAVDANQSYRPALLAVGLLGVMLAGFIFLARRSVPGEELSPTADVRLKTG